MDMLETFDFLSVETKYNKKQLSRQYQTVMWTHTYHYNISER